MNTWGKIGTGTLVVASAGAIALGGVALFQPAAAEQPAPAPAYVMTDPATLETVNGLAGEQEAEASAAEQARIAAEAEAARVAAEQAAAAEAARIAAEQAAQQQAIEEAADAPVYDEPEVPDNTGPVPGTQVHTICQVLADGTQVPCQY